MTPEAIGYLAKADEALIKARKVRQIDLHDEAGRHAYYACFHAAQAVIFERTGKASKTHSGVRTQFAMLTKNEPGLAPEHVTFLARAYGLKSAADYETGESAIVSAAEAEQAIAAAARMLADVRTVLAPESP